MYFKNKYKIFEKKDQTFTERIRLLQFDIWSKAEELLRQKVVPLLINEIEKALSEIEIKEKIFRNIEVFKHVNTNNGVNDYLLSLKETFFCYYEEDLKKTKDNLLLFVQHIPYTVAYEEKNMLEYYETINDDDEKKEEKAIHIFSKINKDNLNDRLNASKLKKS